MHLFSRGCPAFSRVSLEAGRLMQVELERLGLTEDELSADFKAWRKQRQQNQAI